MQAKKNKLPLVLGGAFALLAIGSAILMFFNLSQVSVQDVYITNVKDTGATVVYMTNKPVKGSIIIDRLGIFYDDRAIREEELGEYEYREELDSPKMIHHITIRNLEPETSYTFKIKNSFFAESGKDFNFTTTAIIDSMSAPDPTYGRVFDESRQPISEGVILLDKSIYGTEKKSQLISSYISNGTYSIDTSNIHNQDFGSLFQKEDGTQENIVVVGIVNEEIIKLNHSIELNKKQPVGDLILKNNVKGLYSDIFNETKAQISCTCECGVDDDGNMIDQYCGKISEGSVEINGNICQRKEVHCNALATNQGQSCRNNHVYEEIVAVPCIFDPVDDSVEPEILTPLRTPKEECESKEGGNWSWVIVEPSSELFEGRCINTDDITLMDYCDTIGYRYYSCNELNRNRAGCYPEGSDIKEVCGQTRQIDLINTIPEESLIVPDVPEEFDINNPNRTRITGCTGDVCNPGDRCGNIVEGDCTCGKNSDGEDNMITPGALCTEAIYNGAIEDNPIQQEQSLRSLLPIGNPLEPGDLGYHNEDGDWVQTVVATRVGSNARNVVCNGYTNREDCLTDDCIWYVPPSDSVLGLVTSVSAGGIASEGESEILRGCWDGYISSGSVLDCTIDWRSTCPDDCRDCGCISPANTVHEARSGEVCGTYDSENYLVLGQIPPGERCNRTGGVGKCYCESRTSGGALIRCEVSHGERCTVAADAIQCNVLEYASVEPIQINYRERCPMIESGGPQGGCWCYQGYLGENGWINDVERPELRVAPGIQCITSNDNQELHDQFGDQSSYFHDETIFSKKNNLTGTVLGISHAQGEEVGERTFVLSNGQYELQGENVTTKTLEVEGDRILRFFYDINGDGIRQDDEPFIDFEDMERLDFRVRKEADLMKYSLVVGWNSVSFPMLMTGESTSNIKKASELIRELNNQGAFITQVYTYRNGVPLNFTMREDGKEDMQFGNDFNILPGEAYFVKNYSESMVRLSGKKVEGSLPIQIQSGWNLVGLYSENLSRISGFEVLGQMNSKSLKVDTLSKWDSGMYQNIIFKEGIEYGNDFDVFPGAGYWVRSDVSQPTQFQLEE